MQLNKSQVESILKNAPIGADKTKILDGLITRGYQLEGIDTNAAKMDIQKRTGADLGVNTPNMFQRVGTELAKRSENVGAIATREGENANKSGLQLGINAANQVIGAVPAAAYAALPQGVQNVGNKVGETIGKGFNAVTDFIGSNPALQRYVTENPNNAQVVQDIASLLQGGSELVGNIAVVGSAPRAISNSANAVADASMTAGRNAVNTVSNTVGSGVQAVKSAIDTPMIQGIKGTASELADRVPRAIARSKEELVAKGNRANAISKATPQVAEAMKVGLDDNIINATRTADTATRSAYKKMVDIASKAKDKLGVKERPEIVAGNSVVDQFKKVDAFKKQVGAKIGAEADALSKNGRIPVIDAIDNLDNTLSSQGISVNLTDTGAKELDFTGSSYTPAQRTKVSELYKLATEGGDALTPSELYKKDRLFSQLQREAKYEGLGDIVINTPSGPRSIFSQFRDVFSNKLAEISPKIGQLNKQYAQIKAITDDVENSILKGGNFNATKGMDGATFAQTNLRRIFSDAQSAGAYGEIASKLDKVARKLGYKGPNPAQLSAFATEMRKLFPDTVPENSFQGGIKTSIGGVIDTIKDLGTPNLTDKQRALINLLK